jgi:hypothetical protein
MVRLAATILPTPSPLGVGVGPRHLQPPGRIIDVSPSLGQDDEMGATVMRVRRELDETIRQHVVDDALHTLPIESHIAGEPSNRLRSVEECDNAQNLPAGAGQAQSGNEPIPRNQQQDDKGSCHNRTLEMRPFGRRGPPQSD